MNFEKDSDLFNVQLKITVSQSINEEAIGK